MAVNRLYAAMCTALVAINGDICALGLSLAGELGYHPPAGSAVCSVNLKGPRELRGAGGPEAGSGFWGYQAKDQEPIS
jgi:hypothetical protein